MQYTENYQYRKPVIGIDVADVKDINFNSDKTDTLIHNTQISLAPAYDLTKTYDTGDVVMYETLMYKCKEDNVTGAWDASKWERTTAGEEGAGGGGGSSVVPNPQGEPTDTLETIEIDGTIFDIAGSGGGSSAKKDILYTNDTNSNPNTITLSNNFDEYDLLSFRLFRNADNISENSVYLTVDTQLLSVGKVINLLGWAGSNEYVLYSVSDVNELSLLIQGSNLYIREIAGIKIGGGGGDTHIDLLWDYVNDNSGNIYWSGNALTLNGDIRNYDEVVVEIVSAQGNVVDQWKSSYQWRLLVDPLINSFEPGTFTMCSYDQRSAKFQFTNTTLQKLLGNSSENGVIRVYGVTYGGAGGSEGETSEYIPYSNKNNIVCEATLDNFDASSLEWGDGESPIILSQTVSMYNNEAVSIPVNTSGVIAYSDVGGNKQPFTAYMVCKAQTAGTYTRILSALENHSTNLGAMVFGTNNVNIGSWNGSTPTGLSATSDYIVCAIQYTGYGLGYCKVNNIDLTPFPLVGSNRYITIGRTDIGSGGDQEPCDILVKYFGVVEGTDSHKAINENVAYLMDKFGIN